PSDRNLLFAVIALHAGLLDKDQFVKGCTLWNAAPDVPLADVLVEHGWLTPEDKAHVEYLLERRLRKHGGDVQASLDDLRRNSPDVEQSLDSVGAPPSTDPDSTVDRTPSGDSARDGLRYQILRPHAQGGLGEVFVARDAEIPREVALKQIRPEYADDPHSQ